MLIAISLAVVICKEFELRVRGNSASHNTGSGENTCSIHIVVFGVKEKVLAVLCAVYLRWFLSV